MLSIKKQEPLSGSLMALGWSRGSLAALSVIAVVFALMCVSSWQKWTAIEIDSGREMNVPLRVLNGETIYSEVYYQYGPLPLYVNAFLYKIFGVHLNTLYLAGIVCSFGMLFILFRLGQRFMGTLEATIATLAVAALCMFKYAGQTIFPYTFAALYGTLFSTAALFLQIRYSESQKDAALILSGMFGGLALISKVEFGFAVLISTIVLIFSSPRELRSKIALLSVFPALIIPIFTYTVLAFKMPLKMIIQDCFWLPQYIPRELVYFNKSKSGFDNISKSMTEIFVATIILVSLAGAIGLICIHLEKSKQNVPNRWLHSLYSVTGAGLILLAVTYLISGKIVFISPLRALPVLCAVLIYRFLNHKREPQTILLMSVYSLAVLGRFITRVPSGGTYGAHMLPVPILLFTYSVTTAYPGLFSKLPKAGHYARLFGVLLISMTITASLFISANRNKKEPHYTLQTERGTLQVSTHTGPAVDAALKFLSENTTAKGSVLVIPEGSGINFLASRPSPLRYEQINPGFLNIQAERDAIQQMRIKSVPYVFLLNRPTSEFGATVFGRDYYRELWSWIEDNYELAFVFGNGVSGDSVIGDKNFFIKCYRLKRF